MEYCEPTGRRAEMVCGGGGGGGGGVGGGDGGGGGDGATTGRHGEGGAQLVGSGTGDLFGPRGLLQGAVAPRRATGAVALARGRGRGWAWGAWGCGWAVQADSICAA